MIRMMAVAALALAAACGGGAPSAGGPAPQGPVGELGGTGGGVPDIFALIGARQQMGLTGEQVTALDSIQRVWSVGNDTLRRKLRDAAGAHGRMDLEVARPLLEGLAENNFSAGRAVEALLDEEQRRIACTLRQPASRRWSGSRPPGIGIPGRRGMQPGDQVAADTLAPLRGRRGWHWCAVGVPADSATARTP